MVYLMMKNRKNQSPKTSFIAVGLIYLAAIGDIFQLIGHWAFIDEIGPWLIVLGFASVAVLVTVATVVLVRTLRTVKYLKSGGALTEHQG
jgi:amino acid permease